MTTPTPLRLLLADDHRITLQVLRWSLRAAPDLTVVGEALDGHSAVRLAGELKPDVVVMDVSLPGLDGIEATRQIIRGGGGGGGGRGPRVVALSAHDARRVIRGMFAAGASGYVVKTGEIEDLVQAVRTVAAGGTYLGGAAGIERLRAAEIAGGDGGIGGDPLAPRDMALLRLIAAGRATKEIAAELGVSVKTIENGRHRLLDKLGIDDVATLTRYAVEEGIAPLSDAPAPPSPPDPVGH
ncbi:MAG: DNA-binding response regulator [Phycisphaerales bacterium]|nr:DNA-binding response regulator [Phycisphaerales bacterium]